MSLKNYAKSGHAAWMCNRMYIPVPVYINLAKVNIIKTYICIISISNFNVSCRLRHVNSNTFSRIGDRWSGCKLPSAGLDQYGGILDLPPSA